MASSIVSMMDVQEMKSTRMIPEGREITDVSLCDSRNAGDQRPDDASAVPARRKDKVAPCTKGQRKLKSHQY